MHGKELRHRLRLLIALAHMCEQYLCSDDATLDHLAMSAGEEAVELLVEYGLVTPGGRGGAWTKAGLSLLNSN
jgi:hypothetical protein